MCQFTHFICCNIHTVKPPDPTFCTLPPACFLFSIYFLGLLRSYEHRLLFVPREKSVQRLDVIGLHSLAFIPLKKIKCFRSLFSLQKNEENLLVLPGVLRGRRLSVRWHFDHARKREASPITSSAGLYGAIDLHPPCISAI